jgi:hypothetical protein
MLLDFKDSMKNHKLEKNQAEIHIGFRSIFGSDNTFSAGEWGNFCSLTRDEQSDDLSNLRNSIQAIHALSKENPGSLIIPIQEIIHAGNKVLDSMYSAEDSTTQPEKKVKGKIKAQHFQKGDYTSDIYKLNDLIDHLKTHNHAGASQILSELTNTSNWPQHAQTRFEHLQKALHKNNRHHHNNPDSPHQLAVECKHTLVEHNKKTVTFESALLDKLTKALRESKVDKAEKILDELKHMEHKHWSEHSKKEFDKLIHAMNYSHGKSLEEVRQIAFTFQDSLQETETDHDNRKAA